MLSLAWMASSASRAEEDLAYLQYTMPLDAIRSTLQYSRSRNLPISSCEGNGTGHVLSMTNKASQATTGTLAIANGEGNEADMVHW